MRPRQMWVDPSFYDLTRQLKKKITLEVGKKPSDADITADMTNLFLLENLNSVVERKMKYKKKNYGRFF